MLLVLLLLYSCGTAHLTDNGKVYLVKNHPFLRLIKISKEMADLLAERQKRQYLVYRQDSGVDTGTGLDLMTPGLEATVNHPISPFTRSLREQLDGLDSTAQYIMMPPNSATFNPNLLNLDTNTANLNSIPLNLDTTTSNPINLSPYTVNLNPSTLNFSPNSVNFDPNTAILNDFMPTINVDSTTYSANVVPLNLNELTSNPNGIETKSSPIHLNTNIDLNKASSNTINLNFVTEQSIVSPRDLDIGNFLATTNTAITLQAFVPVDNPVEITGTVAPPLGVAMDPPIKAVTTSPFVSAIESPMASWPTAPPIESPISPPMLSPASSFELAMATPYVGSIYSDAPAPQVIVPRLDTSGSFQPAVAIPREEVASASMVPFVPPPVLAANTPPQPQLQYQVQSQMQPQIQPQIQPQMQPQIQAIMPAIQVMPTVESIALVAMPRCQISGGAQGSCPGIHADVTPNVAGLISLAAYSALPTLETPTGAPQTNSQFVMPALPLPEQGGSISSCTSSCGNALPSALPSPLTSPPPITQPPPPTPLPSLPPSPPPPSASAPLVEATSPIKSTSASVKCTKTTKIVTKADEITTQLAVTNGSIDSMLQAIKVEIGQIKYGRFSGRREGLPCALQGSWQSDSAGVIFTITKPDDIEFPVPVTPWPERRGFFSSCDWEVSAFVPFPKLSFFMMTAIHPSSLRMATFSGECRVCNGKEFIAGHWLVVRGQKNCEDLNRAQDFFGDLWKRKCS